MKKNLLKYFIYAECFANARPKAPLSVTSEQLLKYTAKCAFCSC